MLDETPTSELDAIVKQYYGDAVAKGVVIDLQQGRVRRWAPSLDARGHETWTQNFANRASTANATPSNKSALLAVLCSIETLGKLVVAAINGLALGAVRDHAVLPLSRRGGKSNAAGLPEVKVGLFLLLVARSGRRRLCRRRTR